MIDNASLFLLAINLIGPELSHLLGPLWAEFEKELEQLTHELEQGTPGARKRIIGLFRAQPGGYERLIQKIRDLNIEFEEFRKGPTEIVTAAMGREFVIVPIYYATNRSRPTGRLMSPYYGAGRGVLRFGRLEISIPIQHKIGELERPKWWKLEFTENPRKHITIRGITELGWGSFRDSLNENIEDSSEHDSLIFVHGYNVNFRDAAIRTAQIAADLKFQGPTILFSWPSQGKALKYMVDENNAHWATEDLEKFIRMTLTETFAKSVHIIAHSMGGRLLTEALHRLSLSQPLQTKARVRHLIFAAPDIDADTFRVLADQFHSRSERCTLYASSNDEALALSKKLHGYARAGDTGESIVVMPGVDTIDASAMDTSLLGHSYYGSKRSVLSDIHDLIRYNHGPEGRFGLLSRDHALGRYWVFQA
jgi:esterase/lipase superfamily enzyme